MTILNDGAAAVQRLENGSDEFDVCITDLNMPGATGFEIVRLIREKKLSLKTIVIGGYLTAPVREELELLEVDAIIAKPFSVEDIEAAIHVSGW